MATIKVNTDLVKERERASFRSCDFTHYLYGPNLNRKMKKLQGLMATNPKFDIRDLAYLTRTERYVRACERALEFVRIMRENRFMEDDDMVSLMESMSGDEFFVHLHLTMFLPALYNLADDEQHTWWLEKARDFRILGTYAQTELAHGSNVAGLRTTATLDLETDEWVVHTPSLEDSKWWPGGLAKSCTHCVLMARVIIKGKDYGVHAFLFQVRDLTTHESLPGVHVIDIGQKMGYNGMDNGGMRLTNVRIPRRWLLGRYVKVTKDGEYSKVGNEKMMYATMTYTRKQIVMVAGASLGKSVVTAIRYSAVRRQFPELTADLPRDIAALKDVPEAQVLDYLTQLHFLMPLMATAVGFVFAGRYTNDLYEEMMKEARNGDFSRLRELHAVTSALKGSMTMLVSDGIETCRKAMGGHGYLLSAGVALSFIQYVPQATYEGDFVVLSIQCGRALLKLMVNKMRGKPIPKVEGSSWEYLVKDEEEEWTPPEGEKEVDWRDFNLMLRLYEHRCRAMVNSAVSKVGAAVSNGMKPLEALDEVKIELTRITRAHCHVVVLRAFQSYIQASRTSSATYNVFARLRDLYGLHWMEQSFAEFVVTGALQAEHHESLFAEEKRILRELRPDAVALADSWNFSDQLLNSVLGHHDGEVYERIYDMALKEPLNQSDVTEGYRRYIQYILHPERMVSRTKL